MEYLGLDIWMEILSRLVVKDLIRLKSVSKTFLDLISNRDFIRLHLNKSSFRAIHLDRHSYLHLKQHGEAESSLRVIKIDSQTYHNYGKQGEEVGTKCFAISYGSCNGLVCLRPRQDNKYGDGVLLWNPALCRAEFIPIKRPQQIFKSCRLCWFGYDNDEYKLVIGTASHFHRIRLYNAWQSSQKINNNYGYSYSNGVMGTLVHRTVHWPTYYRNDRKLTIISYDLSNQTVGWIATPYEMTKLYTFVLGQVDGCLSTVFGKHNHLHYQMELWVMKEYGVQESWTKLMILPSNFLLTYRIITRDPYAYADVVELDDPAQLTSPIYGKHFYVESLISPRSIKTKMS